MDLTRKTLVIFDCDGVLVDSEPIALEVLVDALAAKGVVIDAESASERFLGRSLAHLAGSIRAEFGVDIDAEFLSRMRDSLHTRFRAQLMGIPGVSDLIADLREAQMQWCVASSSQVERVELSLSLTGLLPSFTPHIFSATMVENGKPAPDLFLHAAHQMGFEPDQCIVVEDSRAGILAAQAAGMRVCAFTGGSHASSEAYRAEMRALNPDCSATRMNEVADYILNQGTA